MDETLAEIGVYRIENRLCSGIVVLFVTVVLFGESYMDFINDFDSVLLILAGVSLSYILGFIIEAIGALLGKTYYKLKLWNKDDDYAKFSRLVVEGNKKLQSLSHNITTASTYSIVLIIIAVLISIKWSCAYLCEVLVCDSFFVVFFIVLFFSGRRNSSRIVAILKQAS